MTTTAPPRRPKADKARSPCISHRFSSVRMADLIVVLDCNTIAEQGSHEQLLAANNLYASMYRQQASAYTD